MNESDLELRQARTRQSLDGLSIGDAFGQYWMTPRLGAEFLRREVPNPVWCYTDDTEMALALVSVLDDYHDVQQKELA